MGRHPFNVLRAIVQIFCLFDIWVEGRVVKSKLVSSCNHVGKVVYTPYPIICGANFNFCFCSSIGGKEFVFLFWFGSTSEIGLVLLLLHDHPYEDCIHLILTLEYTSFIFLAMMPNTCIMHKENLIAQTDVWSLQFGPQKSPSLSLWLDAVLCEEDHCLLLTGDAIKGL